MPQKANILIVDDEARIRDSLASLLKSQGYDIHTAESGEKALPLIQNKTWDIALFDYMLPDTLGHMLIKDLHEKNPDSIAIIMTGNASIDSAVESLRKGAYDYLRKPFEIEELKKTIENALTQKQLIIENKSFQHKLKKSQKQYQYLVNNSPDIIYTLDHKGNFTFVNRSVEELIGLKPKDIIGGHYSKIVGRNNAQNCKWVINERRTDKRTKKRDELQILKFDAQGKPKNEIMFAELQSTGMYKKTRTEALLMRPRSQPEELFIDTNDVQLQEQFVGTYGVIRDITERKTAEIKKKKMKKRLDQAQKMEAVGTVASGVAHDLNNILSSVLAYPELILMEMKENDPLRDYILQIKNSGEKAAFIVKDLLTLARRRISISKVVNLDGIIKEYLCSAEHKKLTAQYPGIIFDLNLSCSQSTILGSPVHLHKCLMNLCINAVEAMPSGGQINLRTKLCTIDASQSNHINIQPGKYIKLSISDSGIGIRQDEIKKIFDPFYTNKTMGQSGTGLGLAIVWTTIEDHHAYIDVKSQIGNGTTFSLYFPITSKKKKEKSTFDIEMIKGHGESILIVDDIPEQREMAMRMMSALGYKTSCVATGEESIKHIKSHKTDLMLLDMILGTGLDGLDTYREIKKLNPKIKVIIVSGAAQSDRINQALTIGARQFIKKPYSLETMGTSIHKEINN